MKKSNKISDRPKVTVLMPVYNGEKYLREAIDSILEQTFANFEYLIIDDGSTDNTWQILQEYAAMDQRIVLIQNDNNLGLTKSLNKGLSRAKGEYIARMDADDISLPERLAAQVSFLDKHHDVGVVGAFAKKIDENGHYMATWRFPTMHGPLVWALCFTTPLVHPTVTFRKSVINCVDGYNDTLSTSQDRDIYQRLSLVTRFANLPDVHLLYRWHKNNVSCFHRDLQKSSSVKAGQRMIFKILQYEVPFEICYNLTYGPPETGDDVIDAARLIRSLYDAFVSKQQMSLLEKRAIRKDAASRLFNLAWHWKRMPQTWPFFASATQLDPLVSVKVLGKKAKWKIINALKRNVCFSLL